MTQQVLFRSAFVSHDAEDFKKAEIFVATLEARGAKCWIAPRDVRPGQEYAAEIMHGIEKSECLVLLLSKSANESRFVRMEVERAVSKNKSIFTIRIENVAPSPSLELFLGGMQWIDAWTGNLSNHADRLADVLGYVIDDPSKQKAVKKDDDNKLADRLKAFFKNPFARDHLKLSITITVALSLLIVVGGGIMLPSLRNSNSGIAYSPAIAPQPGPVPTGPTSVDKIAQAFQAVGVDPTKLTKDDFTVNIQQGSGISYLIQVTPKNRQLLPAIAPFTTTISFDNGPLHALRGITSPYTDADGSLQRARQFSLLFLYRGQSSVTRIGPFEYPMKITPPR